jgi:hypothetical protein
MRYQAKILFSCFVLLALTFHLKAQNQDYVIITRGDKLPCKITFPVFSIEGKYKTADMSEPEKLDPYQINEYYVAEQKKTYRAVFEPESKALKFMLVLESGKINLYECTIKGYTPNGYASTGTSGGYTSIGYTRTGIFRFIEKKPDIFMEFKPRPFYYDKEESNWRDEFVELIKDNKDVHDKYVADKKFTFKEVIKITHLYNTSEPIPGN